jgi:hypothetical protein
MQAKLASNGGRLPRPLGGIGRDPHVTTLPRSHRSVERPDGLLQRSLRVESVRVEDVDIVQIEPIQRSVEAGQEILPRAQLTVRTRPHVPASLGRDDELVPIGAKVAPHHSPEVLLCRAVGGTVVVGEIEMRDPVVERKAQDFSLGREGTVVTKVVPEAQGERREHQPTPSYPPIVEVLVATFGPSIRIVSERDLVIGIDVPRRRHEDLRFANAPFPGLRA